MLTGSQQKQPNLKQSKSPDQYIHHNQKPQSLHKTKNGSPLNSLVSKIQTATQTFTLSHKKSVFCSVSQTSCYSALAKETNKLQELPHSKAFSLSPRPQNPINKLKAFLAVSRPNPRNTQFLQNTTP